MIATRDQEIPPESRQLIHRSVGTPDDRRREDQADDAAEEQAPAPKQHGEARQHREGSQIAGVEDVHHRRIQAKDLPGEIRGEVVVPECRVEHAKPRRRQPEHEHREREAADGQHGNGNAVLADRDRPLDRTAEIGKRREKQGQHRTDDRYPEQLG